MSQGALARLLPQNAAALTPRQVLDAIERGAVCRCYEYCLSCIVLTNRRQTGYLLIGPTPRPYLRSLVRGLPFTLMSFCFGWWGLPWGVVYTVTTMYTNLKGGIDVTDEVYNALALALDEAPAPTAV